MTDKQELEAAIHYHLCGEPNSVSEHLLWSTIRQALQAQLAIDDAQALQIKAVDVEGLKRSLVDSGIFMDSWNDCIDHLHAQDMLTKLQNVNTSEKHVKAVDVEALMEVIRLNSALCDEAVKEAVTEHLQAQGHIQPAWQDISTAKRDTRLILLPFMGLPFIGDIWDCSMRTDIEQDELVRLHCWDGHIAIRVVNSVKGWMPLPAQGESK